MKKGVGCLAAAPSAVSGYDDQYADLLHFDAGDYEYLRDDSGLITVYTYHDETTATETGAGEVEGYLAGIDLMRGETGSIAPQRRIAYYARSGSGTTVYPVANEMVYRHDNGTGGQATSYAYTWAADSVRMLSVTVTLPAADVGQNGAGINDTVTTVLDAEGRPMWRKDGGGFLTYVEYDAATGAIVKTITDVDTLQTTDFTDLPSGWATPSGGGLHLITTAEVDDLGRVTKLTDA